MLKKRNIRKAALSLGLAGALFFGGAVSAFAAFNFSSTDTDTSASTDINTTFATADQKLGLDSKDSEDTTSAKSLSDSADRAMPKHSVAVADKMAQDADYAAKQLAKSKAIDADKYLATFDEKPNYSSCVASTYGIGDGLMGSGCADGSKVTKTSMGVANKTLALGTKIQIIYNGKVVDATVVDRGPYVDGREFDLQPAVAWALDFDGVGTIQYRVL